MGCIDRRLAVASAPQLPVKLRERTDSTPDVWEATAIFGMQGQPAHVEVTFAANVHTLHANWEYLDVDPATIATTAKATFDAARFARSSMAKAVRGLYGAAKGLNKFVDQHIDDMKASTDASVAGTGRVLEGAKQGLFLGYAAPVVIIATGQLLLGNPLSAVGTVASAATLMNPVASTCAAIGAIWFGWKALSKSEQDALLGKLSKGFSLAVEDIHEVIVFALNLLKSTFGSKELQALKGLLVAFAEKIGRSMYAITGKLKDLIYSTVDDADTDRLLLTGPLMPVLKAMKRKKELEPLLVTSLRVDSRYVEGMARKELERKVARELAKAASYSLPGAKVPAYDDIVRIVARQLELPTRAELRTEDLERAILFKVMERSLEGMSEKQKQSLTRDVQQDLRERGIDRKVRFDQVSKFVKFAVMDVGGTTGTLTMIAPGLTGAIGLNVLQFILLKGIILTLGYVATFQALLGLGFGGAILAGAGAAGPIGVTLALLYTAYSLSGPAFRKLIPSICVIAAKRVELDTRGADRLGGERGLTTATRQHGVPMRR